jgi:hypothetical protein
MSLELRDIGTFRSIGIGACTGTEVDAFADTDALDACIGKHNRIVTRLVHNARLRHKKRVFKLAREPGQFKAPSRSLPNYLSQSCFDTGQPYCRLGNWLKYRQRNIKPVAFGRG